MAITWSQAVPVGSNGQPKRCRRGCAPLHFKLYHCPLLIALIFFGGAKYALFDKPVDFKRQLQARLRGKRIQRRYDRGFKEDENFSPKAFKPQHQSPLLNLPLELRHMIYEYAFSDASDLLVPSNLKAWIAGDTEKLSTTHTTLNFLLTCRQVYYECREIAFRGTIFCFNPSESKRLRKAMRNLEDTSKSTSSYVRKFVSYVGLRRREQLYDAFSYLRPSSRSFVERLAYVDVSNAMIWSKKEPDWTWIKLPSLPGLREIVLMCKWTIVEPEAVVDLLLSSPRLQRIFAVRRLFDDRGTDTIDAFTAHLKYDHLVPPGFRGNVNHIVCKSPNLACVGMEVGKGDASLEKEFGSVRHVHLYAVEVEQAQVFLLERWINECPYSEAQED